MLDQRCLCNGCELNDLSLSVPCTRTEGFSHKGTRHGPPPAVAYHLNATVAASFV